MARKKKEAESVKLLETNVPSINVDEVKEELRVDLKNYIDDYSEKRLLEELEKSNKRLIKEKNRKIIFRDIIIILLMFIIVFLMYVLYRIDFFDRFFNKNSANNNVVEVIKDDEKKEEIKEVVNKEPTLEELKKEYGTLINNYYLNENSDYLKDFFDGKLSSEIKKYITLNNLADSDISNEEDYSSIKENTFKEKYLSLFEDDYSKESFVYNGNKIRLLLGSFVSEKKLKIEKTGLKREIINIKKDNDKIYITTSEKANNDEYSIVYVFKNNKLIDLNKTS